MKKPERITNTHIYFWGSFYSQWAKYYITDNSLQQQFSSCEQYMMYHKAILFKDEDLAKKILETNNVKKQKELGRTVKGFNQEEWDTHKFNIIVKGNLLKFSQNKDIQKELISSGEKILVEASPYDKIYGVGLKYDNDLILDEKNWKGENLLGKALMEVREILRIQNGDKLKEFFNQSPLNKEDYLKEIKKELNETVGQNNRNSIVEQIKDVKEKIKTTDNSIEKMMIEHHELRPLLFHLGEITFKEKAEVNTPLSKNSTSKEIKLYDKLIRDKIPQIIMKNKKTCETHYEENKELLLTYYLKKIEEETKEVLNSKSKEEIISELADLSEVIDGLISYFGMKESFDKIKNEKKSKNGGFSNLILNSVSSEVHEWFYYKNDKFRSCKKCGTIENEKNSNSNCIGNVRITLRNNADNIANKNELEKRLKVGLDDAIEGKVISSEELKKKLTDRIELFKEVEGSILNANEDIIAQGCNCSGASGAGIAKYIAEKYPESDKKYKEMCKNKNFHLGTVLFNKEKEKVQAFCGTQLYYGKFLKMDKDSVEGRYKAIEECLTKIYHKAKSENLSVASPRIGCGRARADWNRVKAIIKKIFHDYPVTIYWIPDSYSKK